MVFWVPEILPIISPYPLGAGTQSLSDGVDLSAGKTELQDQPGRQVGGASPSSSSGWSSDQVLGVCGNPQLWLGLLAARPLILSCVSAMLLDHSQKRLKIKDP